MRSALAFLIMASPLATLLAADTALEPLRFSAAHMDATAHPGDDFYRFACGSWLKASSIPPDLASWTPTNHLMEANLLVLKRICEAAAAKPDRSRAERQSPSWSTCAGTGRRSHTMPTSDIARST